MLKRLYIKNYAIIDETEVIFNDKLNILTGETGAGKSILIGSVNAALGGKVTKDVIRHGADYAVIEITFSELPDRILDELREEDIYTDDGELILSRKITAQGKNTCKINGETVSQAVLKGVSEKLLDIHGQHEHHSLLSADSHMRYVDKFAGEKLSEVMEKLSINYREYKGLKQELADAEKLAQSPEGDTGYLEYVVNEIRSADLKEGEDDGLEEEYKTLSNSKLLTDSLGAAISYVTDGGEGAESLISTALRSLKKASEVDSKVADMQEGLVTALDLISDFSREAYDYIDELSGSEERFSYVMERLDLINSLKKKHVGLNGSIKALNDFCDSCEEKLAKMADLEGYIESLKEKVDKAEKTCLAICRDITALREKACDDISLKIQTELKDLNFLQANFVAVRKDKLFDINGADSIEFMISLNPGEPLKPLTKIASGGELSRIMLGLKSVLADKDEIPTLIFDEIDSGISGRTAQKVSEHLGRLGGNHQIICITHLAQIAAMADSHYLIEKTGDETKVSTQIKELSGGDRIGEIARILSGAEVTESVMKSAEEMISLAQKIKEV